MTVELAAYGPTSHVSEQALLRGYGAIDIDAAGHDLVDAQACACGGAIDPVRESVVAHTVRQHNDTPQHAAWRARMGIR